MQLAMGGPLRQLTEDLRGVVLTPEARLRWMAGARGLGDAAAVVAALCLLQLAAGLIEAIRPVALWTTPGNLPPEAAALVDQATESAVRVWNRYRLFFPLAAALSIPLLWFLGAGVVHVTAHLLGGHGRYRQYLVLTGYLQGLAALAIPLSLAAGTLALAGRAETARALDSLALLIALAIVTARVVLEIIAARVVYQLSAPRATVAVLTPYTIPLVAGLALAVWATVLLLTGNLAR